MLKRSSAWRSAVQSWTQTLRLPRSDLPALPDPALQPKLLQSCSDDLYAWQASARPANNSFILHDGPPYANGDLHIGHALNKILKDIFNRFQLSQGKRVNYLPGWDCHGLPIELKALQKGAIKANDEKIQSTAIREAAAQLAAATIEDQERSFKSWAIMGDWDHAYRTMSKTFEIKQLTIFKTLVQKGLIYRQHKPVYWSPSSRTALAEAELEYDEDYVSQAAYVKFQLTKLPPVLQSLSDSHSVNLLIWTTTPWTLPANKAIAVHPNLTYCVFQWKDEYFVVASTRLQEVAAAAQVPETDMSLVLKDIKGHDLADGGEYENTIQSPQGQSNPILVADYVTSDTGTGLVHTAPGHGFDDFELCRNHGLTAFAPVDESGVFTKDALSKNSHLLQGKPVLGEGNEAVLDLVKATKSHIGSSIIWATHRYKHSYPIDWRTKQPVIIKATSQWFADVNDIKDLALKSLEKVNFVPENGRSRLRSFIRGRSAWCISRQRAWGVPIPVLYKHENDHEEAILSSDSISHVINTIAQRGTDAWWNDPVDDSRWISPTLPAGTYTRGEDTMDVWFDSGTTWSQLDEQARPNGTLADVYIEGSDQHRGWFQSSLLTRISCLATPNSMENPSAPFMNLITHGFILDEKGRKMSKSVGNVIRPNQIIDGTLLPPLKPRTKSMKKSRSDEHQHDTMGPDLLRLWVAKQDYANDVPVGVQVLQGVHNTLHKYRVTLKWLLGVLHDYDQHAAHPAESYKKGLGLSNRLALRHLTQAGEHVHSAYMSFQPFKAMRELERYVYIDLSSFFLETAKDVVYTSVEEDRRRAQYVCNEILQALLFMLAPITPLLVAECLHYAPLSLQRLIYHQRKDPFRCTWKPNRVFDDDGGFELDLNGQSYVINSLRQVVNGAQEQLRTVKQIGSGLQTRVEIDLGHCDERSAAASFLRETVASGELAQALVVSEVILRQAPREDTRSVFTSDTTDPLPSIASQLDLNLTGATHTFNVVISRAHGTKCPRCWRYVIQNDGHNNHRKESMDCVCRRCQIALDEMKHSAVH